MAYLVDIGNCIDDFCPIPTELKRRIGNCDSYLELSILSDELPSQYQIHLIEPYLNRVMVADEYSDQAATRLGILVPCLFGLPCSEAVTSAVADALVHVFIDVVSHVDLISITSDNYHDFRRVAHFCGIANSIRDEMLSAIVIISASDTSVLTQVHHAWLSSPPIDQRSLHLLDLCVQVVFRDVGRCVIHDSEWARSLALDQELLGRHFSDSVRGILSQCNESYLSSVNQLVSSDPL